MFLALPAANRGDLGARLENSLAGELRRLSAAERIRCEFYADVQLCLASWLSHSLFSLTLFLENKTEDVKIDRTKSKILQKFEGTISTF